MGNISNVFKFELCNLKYTYAYVTAVKQMPCITSYLRLGITSNG